MTSSIRLLEAQRRCGGNVDVGIAVALVDHVEHGYCAFPVTIRLCILVFAMAASQVQDLGTVQVCVVQV